MKKKILIVDDDPDMLSTVKYRLEANNYEVLTADDGHAGLIRAQQESVDLIILDIMLPKMNGFNICRMIKFDERTKHVPVILLSSRDKNADHKTSEDVRADAYIQKPFDANKLLSKIRELTDI